MLSEEDGQELLRQFPEVIAAFAYGSGAIPQQGYCYKDKNNLPMIDFIFVVENPLEWHKKNMVLNMQCKVMKLKKKVKKHV